MKRLIPVLILILVGCKSDMIPEQTCSNSELIEISSSVVIQGIETIKKLEPDAAIEKAVEIRPNGVLTCCHVIVKSDAWTRIYLIDSEGIHYKQMEPNQVEPTLYNAAFSSQSWIPASAHP